MANAWRHVFCAECWEERNPGRVAHRVTDDDTAECCACGKDTDEGIYVREDPGVMNCQGVTGVHAAA